MNNLHINITSMLLKDNTDLVNLNTFLKQKFFLLSTKTQGLGLYHQQGLIILSWFLACASASFISKALDKSYKTQKAYRRGSI